jgi:hypothetical protein
MFEPHLSLQAKYILASGSGINAGKYPKGKTFILGMDLRSLGQGGFIKPVKYRGDNHEEKTRHKTVSMGMPFCSIVLLIVIFSSGWIVTSGLPKLKMD